MPAKFIQQHRKETAVVTVPILAVVGYLYTQTGSHAERIKGVETEYVQIDKSIGELKEQQRHSQEDNDRKLHRILDKIDDLKNRQNQIVTSTTIPR